MKKISTLSLVMGISALSFNANAQLINEGFEGTFPATGWTIDNPDGLETFVQATVGKTGSKSAYMDVFNSDGSGQGATDAIITSGVNLTTVTNPTLTFQRAFQMFSDPSTYTPKDSLYVQISTDGGTTWLPLFDKAGVNLVTAATQFNGSVGFVPTTSEWVQESVSLSAYSTATNAMFKFSFMNDWENNFYLDDIVVSGTGGGSVNEISLDAFVSVFPNPSNGNFNVDISANGLGQADIIVYNMVGDEVDRVSYNVLTPKKIKFNLEGQPKGLYFVKVMTATGSATKKMIVN